MVERECDCCGKMTPRSELGRKIRGEYLCTKCKRRKREDRREKTLKDSGQKEIIKRLEKKRKKEYEKRYREKRKRIKEVIKQSQPPVPKGSKKRAREDKSQCYLTFEERKSLLSILMARGLSFDEAKERIEELVESQKELRTELKKEKKSEKEIKEKQKQLLEELWNY